MRRTLILKGRFSPAEESGESVNLFEQALKYTPRMPWAYQLGCRIPAEGQHSAGQERVARSGAIACPMFLEAWRPLGANALHTRRLERARTHR